MRTGTVSRRTMSPGLRSCPPTSAIRDGSYSNFNNTDLNGFAGFNEVFPIFNWYVVETDSTRYKNTGTHVVYDAGGPVDGSPFAARRGIPECGNSTIGKYLARTKEDNSVPASLRVPGSVYCDNADCTGFSIANGPAKQRLEQSLHRANRSSLGRKLRLAGLPGTEPASWSSARNPSSRVRTAASAATSCTPRPVRSTIRRCCSNSVGSPWSRMSPSTFTRKEQRPMAALAEAG